MRSRTPDFAPENRSEWGRAAVAWLRRAGTAPWLLAVAFALPPPQGQGAAIAGLPSLCAFHRITELPCAGCGMTRSVVCCAHGLWTQAVAFHPLGPLLFAALVGLTIVRALSIFRPNLRIVPSPSLTTRACWMSVAALVMVWGARLAGVLPSPQ